MRVMPAVLQRRPGVNRMVSILRASIYPVLIVDATYLQWNLEIDCQNNAFSTITTHKRLTVN